MPLNVSFDQCNAVHLKTFVSVYHFMKYLLLCCWQNHFWIVINGQNAFQQHNGVVKSNGAMQVSQTFDLLILTYL